ncbi:MAG: murein biosynthesis integral membrane protein MurJ [Salinarimonas sp.]|nr:murein biosynthesis integral membrane protein MurJ [Salinarimonas sp.]
MDAQARRSRFTGIAVAAAAGLSRILGFVRDVMIAAVLGAGPAAEALAIALRLPNLARRMVSEGAVNAGFVPRHAQIRAAHGSDAAAGFAGRALTTVGLTVLVLCALATLAAGMLTGLLAGGFAPDDPARDLAVTATRLALPAIAAMTLAALIGATLAANGRFLAVAWSPLLINLAMIALLAAPLAGMTLAPRTMALALAATMSFGALAQLALLVLALRRLPGAVRLRRPAFDADQRRLARLALPALVAAAGSQLILLAAMPAASTIPGALAYLHYAERLLLLPLGLIAATAGVVLLPRLAHQAADGTRSLFRALARRARFDALLLALPAAIGLILLAQPITTALFERGAFDATDARATAGLLAGLACGLPFAVMTKITEHVLFAQQRMRAAAVIALAAFALALPACLLGARIAGPVGIGLGVSIALAGQWLALHLLVRNDPRADTRPSRRRHARLRRHALMRLFAANAVFALIVYGAQLLFALAGLSLASLPVLILFCLMAIIVYALIAMIAGIARRHDPLRSLHRRLRWRRAASG